MWKLFTNFQRYLKNTGDKAVRPLMTVWTVSQLSIMIIQQYMVNFNPMVYDYSVKWQSDLINTNESLLSSHEQRNLQKGEEIWVLRNYALPSTISQSWKSILYALTLPDWRKFLHLPMFWMLSFDTEIIEYQDVFPFMIQLVSQWSEIYNNQIK